jgi:hypothetical protein
MVRIRRWVTGRRGKIVWSEPQLPPWIKINPNATPPGPNEGLQPGDLSMAAAAVEFLEVDEGEEDLEEEEVGGPSSAAPG